jgi:hypothetical protein
MLDRWTWTGSIWLRTGTGVSLVWMRWWTIGFHKMRGIFWVTQEVLASEEGLCSMETVSILHVNKAAVLLRWNVSCQQNVSYFVLMLLFEYDGRSPKHVAENTVSLCVHLYLQIVGLIRANCWFYTCEFLVLYVRIVGFIINTGIDNVLKRLQMSVSLSGRASGPNPTQMCKWYSFSVQS